MIVKELRRILERYNGNDEIWICTKTDYEDVEIDRYFPLGACDGGLERQGEEEKELKLETRKQQVARYLKIKEKIKLESSTGEEAEARIKKEMPDNIVLYTSEMLISRNKKLKKK